jgi:recombinational DNA repair protein RecR
VRVSRIAFGMPVGADFQFVDAQTLGRSLSGRKDFS